MLQEDGWGAFAIGMGQDIAAQVIISALQVTAADNSKPPQKSPSDTRK